MKKIAIVPCVVIAAVLLSGCMTQRSFLDVEEPVSCDSKLLENNYPAGSFNVTVMRDHFEKRDGPNPQIVISPHIKIKKCDLIIECPVYLGMLLLWEDDFRWNGYLYDVRSGNSERISETSGQGKMVIFLNITEEHPGLKVGDALLYQVGLYPDLPTGRASMTYQVIVGHRHIPYQENATC